MFCSVVKINYRKVSKITVWRAKDSAAVSRWVSISYICAGGFPTVGGEQLETGLGVQDHCSRRASKDQHCLSSKPGDEDQAQDRSTP